MAACVPNGRLWTEIHNLPVYYLWKLIEHCPAGDPWLRGESFALIKKRIKKLSDMSMEEIEEKSKMMRDVKSKAQEMADALKQRVDCGWAGGAFTCSILEEEFN